MLCCAQLSHLDFLSAGRLVLVELRLENYAVIDNVAVEFASGLNLLTGETGAGKSILIDALALLLGEKASSDVIRAGADRAIVSAVFEVESGSQKAVSKILENNGLDWEEDSVILRREIAPGGKGRAFVNNQPATVAVLRQLGPHLATVHAQSESLLSFDVTSRLALLDLFAGSQIDATTSASLRAAQKHIEELAGYEPKFQEALAALETARISVEDVGANLRDYAGGIEASPEHLAEVEDRLVAIDRLKRKYGPSLVDVIHHGEEVSRKLSEMENKDEILGQLRKELAEAGGEYLRAAHIISKKRYEAARKLEKLVESEINDLAMRSNFRIEVSGTDEEGNWAAFGFDQVLYLISTNPGEPLRPLEQIASGGELSRVMLALKASVEAASAKKKTSGAQRTMVFDEIDIGIGGRAAEAVGRKLKQLSRSNQVLCVTHLPQIATFAHHHYVIEKKQIAGRTRTAVRPITGDERTEEIARMLSGAKLTDTSRKHAEQMLKANA